MPATLPASIPAPSPQLNAYERTSQAFIFNQVSATQTQTGTAAPSGANIYGMTGVVSRGQLPYNLALQIDVSGGTLSALTVNLLGSLDGVNFYSLGSENSATGGLFPFSGILARYITASITVFTSSGGSPVVSVSFAA